MGFLMAFTSAKHDSELHTMSFSKLCLMRDPDRSGITLWPNTTFSQIYCPLHTWTSLLSWPGLTLSRRSRSCCALYNTSGSKLKPCAFASQNSYLSVIVSQIKVHFFACIRSFHSTRSVLLPRRHHQVCSQGSIDWMVPLSRAGYRTLRYFAFTVPSFVSLKPITWWGSHHLIVLPPNCQLQHLT